MGTYNIDVYYCDEHGVVSVTTSPLSCLTQGTVYNVSAAEQTLRVPFTCCVDYIEWDEELEGLIDYNVYNSYFELYVEQNNTGAERTFEVIIHFCDGSSTTIYVIQSNIYERWVQIPIDEDYICDDCDAYNKLVATYADGVEYIISDGNPVSSSDIKKSKDIIDAEIGVYVTEIGSGAFNDCIALSGIDFGDSLTTIGSNAFKGCINLRDIELPDTLEEIGDNAFNGCRNLTSIVLPEGLSVVGTNVFSGCNGVTDLYIPSTLSSMTNSSFEFPNYLNTLYIGSPTYLNTATLKQKNAKNVTIGGSVTTIPTYCFNQLTTENCTEWTGNRCISAACSAITSLTIESPVTEISKAAFQGCVGLKNVTLPNTLTTIGESAFKDCNVLSNIVIPSGVTTIGSYAFRCDALHFAKSITFLSEYPPQIGTDVFDPGTKIFVPNEYLDNYLQDSNFAPYLNELLYVHPDEYELLAYASDSNLNNVCQECDGTDTLTPLPSIRYDKLVFGDCVSSFEELGTGICAGFLDTVEFSSAITNIHDNAFSLCLNLSSITFADNSQLATIGDYAFNGCRSLSSITIPSGVTSIGEGAFQYTSALTNVTFAEGSQLASIGEAAFDCHTRATGYERSGIKSINIPSGVTSIGSSAFTDCIYLTSVTFDSGSQLSSITEMSFYGTNSLEGSITIPSGVTSIGDRAFEIDTLYPYMYSDQKLRRLYFENGSRLNSIGLYAFNNRYNLDYVELPEGLVTISDVAFYHNENMRYAIIPSTVTTIGEGAFSYCLSLQYIVCNATTPPTISSHTFYNGEAASANTYAIYVPSASVEAYKSAWSAYASRIQAIPNVLPEITDKIEVYYANGESAYTFPLYDRNIYYPEIEGSEIVAVNFGSGVRSISGIPETVTSVTFGSGSSLLKKLDASGCANLKNITIPSGVTNDSTPIDGVHSFLYLKDCSSLSSVTFAEGSQLGTILDGSFSGCANLKNITIPSGVTGIGDSAFSECGSLSSVTFAEGSQLKSIGENSFHKCSGLTSISIPSGVTSIGNEAFNWCSGLTSVEFANGSQLTNIGISAFAKCYSLSSFTVPSGVTSIGNYAFSSCTSLESVTFAEGSLLERFDFRSISSSGLERIVFPSGLTTVTWHGEYYSIFPYIKNVTFTSEIPPTGSKENTPFSFSIGGKDDFKIYVPSSAVNAYKASIYFSNYIDVIYPIP